jgi:hypothetical protein
MRDVFMIPQCHGALRYWKRSNHIISMVYYSHITDADRPEINSSYRRFSFLCDMSSISKVLVRLFARAEYLVPSD